MFAETIRDRLDRLRGKGDPADWQERRMWAGEIITRLCSHPEEKGCAMVLEILAGDSKWEVRKALADSMLELPDDIFSSLLKKLSDDENAFVANAVKRALARRSPKPTRGNRSRHKGLQQQLKEIKDIFGADAAKKAANYGERLAREVLFSVAHDIKTALTPCIPSIREVHSRVMDDAFLKGRMSQIERATKDLETLYKDIGDYARTLEIDTQPETLAGLVSEAIENAKSHLQGMTRDPSSVKVEFSCDEHIRIPVSRAHICMAFTNLIKNAIESHGDRHKFREGRVKVEVSRDQQGVLIVISDTGGGLSNREFLKLLEFVPGNSSKGTGYGLPIAKRYIEAHRGTLALENQEGVGLSVKVFLPDYN